MPFKMNVCLEHIFFRELAVETQRFVQRQQRLQSVSILMTAALIVDFLELLIFFAPSIFGDLSIFYLSAQNEREGDSELQQTLLLNKSASYPCAFFLCHRPIN